MQEIELTKQQLNALPLFNKGGFESRIYLYEKDLLLKSFKDEIRNLISVNLKKYKVIRLYEKNIPKHIMIKPLDIVNVDGKFNGYIMPKIENGLYIENIKDYGKLVRLFRLLFKNLELLHQNKIVVNDIKLDNILVCSDLKPTFVDVDSMGIEEYPPDFPKIRSAIMLRLRNMHLKLANNNIEELDKLKLLVCFIDSLAQKKTNRPLLNVLFESDLSDEFKNFIANIILKDDNLENDFFYLDNMFANEEDFIVYKSEKTLSL